MPRPIRLDLPGIPQHVVQRGVDRRPCFLLDIHYSNFLQHLGAAAGQFECDIHAYVLMCNHFHLLATPRVAGGIGRMMQALSRKYVSFANYTLGRSGPMWQGRYKSCFVGSQAYALACYRYIELNPTRAGMVAQPARYRWSSYAANALGRPDGLLTPHPAYLALGADAQTRQRAYRLRLEAGNDAETEAIRSLTRLQRAYGDSRFLDELERAHGRPMRPLKLGRPSKTAASETESSV